ncbi:MAG TPA: hypothetical protein VFY84_14695 [Jiangellales bacterium]|nr:hypothetical protein [Jiangellales bacterium]
MFARVVGLLQQHHQRAVAVADDSEELSSVVLEPRFEHSVVDSYPNDVGSLRTGQRRVTILLASASTMARNGIGYPLVTPRFCRCPGVRSAGHDAQVMPT